MRSDLLTLLNRRSIGHPTSIASVEIQIHRELRVKLRGIPWWSENMRKETDAEIIFVFENVSSGSLDLEIADLEYDEVLETFSIREAEDCDWAQAYGFEIYCSSPIPNPMEIFTITYDWLIANKSIYNVSDFLNTGSGNYLSGFKKITASNSFLLARAPQPLCGQICDELTRQDVKHNKLATTLRDTSRLIVELDGSSFFCQNAYAEFTE